MIAKLNEVQKSIDRIAFHALPYGHEMFSKFVIYVVRRPEEKWVVQDMNGFFYAPGHKVSRKIDEAIITYDPKTGDEVAIDDDYTIHSWYETFWLDLAGATELAMYVAEVMTCNGKPAAEFPQREKPYWQQ